jgi:glucuronate isomerase
MAFINNDFLLQTKAAQRLYHGYAANQPILDFHCHLPAREIAVNRRFNNLYEIWLEGDHYKWRAMRSNGVSELYCTGPADAYEKFLAWARTVPATLRNSLYHWTHLELKRYFGIDDLLDESTASRIWERANSLLRSDDFSVHGILDRFRVRVVCTSDDPADSLEHHQTIAASKLETAVYPTFRPDAALRTSDPQAFNDWVDRLAASANVHISDFNDFRDALTKRHWDFHEAGCRLSDHGLNQCCAGSCSQAEAGVLFSRLRAGQAITKSESEGFAGFMMLFFGRLDAEKGWTKQLHLGANRDVNSHMVARVGGSAGFDSVGDWRQAGGLTWYLSRLEQEGALPKIVLYNSNPADNYVFATIAGTFHESGIPSKIQFGSAWWFLDQKEGIELQLNALSSAGLLSRFIGMVTDSRSFMSFPRHEYFRRVLCNLLGDDMEGGLLPHDEGLIGKMVSDICANNAASYLGFKLDRRDETAAAGNGRRAAAKR